MQDDISIAVYLYEPSDGGLDRVAILLANDLRRRGIDVELWVAHAEGPLRDLIDPAVPIRRIPAPRWPRGLALMAQFPALRAAVRRRRPDILYSAGNQSNGVVALAAWGTRTKAVGRISNPIVKPGLSGLRAWARSKRFRAIAHISAMTIVMGETDRAMLGAEGALRGTRVVHLPRPTVTPAIEKAGAARRPRAKGEPWRLVMAGRLAAQKGQATALAALARMRDVDWRLKIAGKGPLLAQLQEECRRLDIGDRVEFLGFVDSAERLAAIMADSDVLLQPSLWEGFCGVLVEALGSCANVVATDSTANIHPLLAAAGQHPPTPVGDVDAFERAIRWTLDNPTPSDELRRAVEPYRVEAAFQAHLAAFSDLLEDGGPSRNR